MKKHQDAKAQIHELIDRLSTNHILKNSSQSYVHDFVTARRLPDYLKTYEEMKQTIESGTSGIRFVLGKNRDLRMKDCLVLANEKFPPEAGVDDLNILFLSCGHFYRIAEWYMCLYRRGGLFGPEPFHPPESFARVDVVILSSLRYRHEHARAYPAWTLDGVLLLPIINTHGRSSRTSQAVREGLGIFKHCLSEFSSFPCSTLILDEHTEQRESILRTLKVNRFIGQHPDNETRARYFPVHVNS